MNHGLLSERLFAMVLRCYVLNVVWFDGLHVWALSLSRHTDRQAAQDLILSAAATLHIPLPTQGAKRS